MLAIDFGSSSIKVALSANKLELLQLDQKVDFFRAELSQLFSDIEARFGKQETMRVTGGKSMILPREFEGRQIEKVNEIQAIGKGGLYLSKLPEAIIVNLGSGTTLVHAKKVAGNLKFSHLGGLAMGGSSLQALAKMILEVNNFKQLEKLAEKGDYKKVDSLIGEITGIKISDKLPLDRPAAHFAKINEKGYRKKKTDLASALFNMFTTTLVCYLMPHSQQMLCKRIILTGTLSKSETLQEQLNSFEPETGLRFYFPKNAEFATVIGAVI